MRIIPEIAYAGVVRKIPCKRGLGFPSAWEKKKQNSLPPADEPFISGSLLCLWPALLCISVGQAGATAKLGRRAQSR